MDIDEEDYEQNLNKEDGKKTYKILPKIWHHQQEKILKEWAELSASYRWLHNQSHTKFRRQNIGFTLPIIILSTVAGTANFSQSSLTGTFAKYAHVIIGTINLIAGLLATIAEFLKISELSENHRSSSLSFGKLSRNIKVELSLPWSERSSHGRDFIKICRSEIDRLLEQSANIPLDIVLDYEKKFGKLDIYKPEILEVRTVPIYRNEKEINEEHVGKIISNAAKMFHKKQKSILSKPLEISEEIDCKELEDKDTLKITIEEEKEK